MRKSETVPQAFRVFFTVNLVKCKVNKLAGSVLYSTVSQAEGNNRGKFSPFGDLKYPNVSKKMAMFPEYL
jgi:hypothetical protein